ncbi:MAG: DUF115 domain-containing protein [Deltaproteobacteria bacterium]|jgi:hypothetical protein|nr:DUF115 domain-containing protein [Deltaproteobacteria bacterium]
MTDTPVSRGSDFSAGEAPEHGPRVVPGPDGPGLIFMGETIHDAGGPEAEAALWVREALMKKESSPKAPKLALVFGLGLGWHLRRLKELFPEISLKVFEPSRDNLDTFEKYNVLGQNQNPEIFSDFRSFGETLIREVVYGDGNMPLVVVVPGYARAFREEAKEFLSRVNSETTRLKVIIKTRKATNNAFLDNFVKNARHAPLLPDLMLLKSRFAPRAAFAVGAGPSLGADGPILKEVGERGVVMAAATALKPLLSMGVRPDLVIVVESSDTSRNLKLSGAEKKILKPDTVLALAMGCHPAHFEVEGFKKAVFHLTGGESQLLSQGGFLPKGGNAGTAAFALAYVWGLNPLILAGQDQAYQGPMLHVEGSSDSLTETDRPDAVAVPAIGGGEVETNSGLLASINWLAEAANLIATRSPKVRLYNGGSSGASVPGFAEVPLKVLVDNLPEPPKTWKLPDILDDLPRPGVKELKADIKQMSAIMSQIRRLVHKNLQRALIEMMNLSRVSAFMGEILAPALAGGSPANVLKNIAWADGILLKLLTSLDEGKAR